MDCWPGTGKACWLPGSPLCELHNRTGRTLHRRWAHNILLKRKKNIRPTTQCRLTNEVKYKLKHGKKHKTFCCCENVISGTHYTCKMSYKKS